MDHIELNNDENKLNDDEIDKDIVVSILEDYLLLPISYVVIGYIFKERIVGICDHITHYIIAESNKCIWSHILMHDNIFYKMDYESPGKFILTIFGNVLDQASQYNVLDQVSQYSETDSKSSTSFQHQNIIHSVEFGERYFNYIYPSFTFNISKLKKHPNHMYSREIYVGMYGGDNSNECKLFVFNVDDGRLIRDLSTNVNNCWEIELSDDEKNIIIMYWSKLGELCVRILNNNDATVQQIEHHSNRNLETCGSIAAICVHDDKIYTLDPYAETIYVYKIVDGKCVGQFHTKYTHKRILPEKANNNSYCVQIHVLNEEIYVTNNNYYHICIYTIDGHLVRELDLSNIHFKKNPVCKQFILDNVFDFMGKITIDCDKTKVPNSIEYGLMEFLEENSMSFICHNNNQLIINLPLNILDMLHKNIVLQPIYAFLSENKCFVQLLNKKIASASLHSEQEVGFMFCHAYKNRDRDQIIVDIYWNDNDDQKSSFYKKLTQEMTLCTQNMSLNSKNRFTRSHKHSLIKISDIPFRKHIFDTSAQSKSPVILAIENNTMYVYVGTDVTYMMAIK